MSVESNEIEVVAFQTVVVDQRVPRAETTVYPIRWVGPRSEVDLRVDDDYWAKRDETAAYVMALLQDSNILYTPPT